MAITKVTNSLVATNAIQGTLIADNAITSVHIAQNQVTAVQIPDGSITSTQLGANSVDSSELVDGSIDTSHIADAQITTAKLGTNQVTSAKIAQNSIEARHIADGSITDTQLGSGAFTMGTITTTGAIRGPASLTIDPATVGDNTGTVVIAGNLQVDGTTTTVNSTTLDVADKNITLGKGGSASANNGGGITIDGANATLLYASSGDKFVFNKDIDVTGNIGISDGKIFNGTSNNSAGVSLPNSTVRIDGYNGITFHSSATTIGSQTERMRIDSSGNVGIGVTSNLLAKLHIGGAPIGNAGALAFLRNTSAASDNTSFGGIHFSSSPGTDYSIGKANVNGATSLSFRNGNSGASLMELSSAGNLGIGTTPGDIRLKVHSNDSDDYIAIFKQTHASNLGTVQIDSPTDSNGRPSRLDFARGGVNKWKTGMVYGDTTNGWGLSDDTGSGTALQQTRFLVTPTGKVGIGEISPDLPLHVSGTVALPATSGSTPTGFVSLRAKTAGGSHGLHIGVSNASPWGSWLQAQDGNNLATEYPLLLNPNGGNVGIGTTAPSHKLHVNGTTLIDGTFGNPNTEGAYRLKFYDNGGTYNDAGIGLDGSAGGENMWFNALNGFYWNFGTNGKKMALLTNGNLGIGDTDPPSTLTVLGTNTADVASNGAGINGLHITRTSTSGENIYAYMTDGNAAASSWDGQGNVAKIESFGNNAFEIGTQQDIPVVIGQENEQKLRIKGDITAHAKIGATYVESLITPNGGTSPINTRIFEDHLGKWVAVGYFAANAATSIQGTWSSVTGMSTNIGQSETTAFSADWGDSYPTEVRYMGASDFYNFNETKTIDFIHGVPRGRPWKEFFNNAQRRPDAATPHSGTSHMGSVQGPTGSEKYGWECRGAYDGRGRWHNPGYTHHRMSDINSTTHLSCPTAAFTTATSNAFNWNTYGDAKISVHHQLEYSGQDTAGYSAAFGRDDTVIAFFDDYPNSRNNMQASTNNYGTAIYVLMKLPEMQSIGLEGGRSRNHMPGEVVQTKVYERNGDVAATSGSTATFGYLDFTPLYGNSLLEFNIHANTGSNDANTVVWNIYQGSSSALGALIRRTGNQIINNDGNTDGQELPFSWTQYYQLNDDRKSNYRYTVNFSASGATYWGHTYGSTAHSYFTIKEIKQEHNATGITD
jgi:hypothetical protein